MNEFESDFRVHPVTHERLTRQVRTMTLTGPRGISETFDMPGWYPESVREAGYGEALHDEDDMQVSDAVIERIRARREAGEGLSGT